MIKRHPSSQASVGPGTVTSLHRPILQPSLCGCMGSSGESPSLSLSVQVPWDDLRYLFGEIMYGGHITDDWDRRLCRTYLSEYVQPEMLDGEVSLAPGFMIPPRMDYEVRNTAIFSRNPLPWKDGHEPTFPLAHQGECRERVSVPWECAELLQK